MDMGRVNRRRAGVGMLELEPPLPRARRCVARAKSLCDDFGWLACLPYLNPPTENFEMFVAGASKAPAVLQDGNNTFDRMVEDVHVELPASKFQETYSEPDGQGESHQEAKEVG